MERNTNDLVSKTASSNMSLLGKVIRHYGHKLPIEDWQLDLCIHGSNVYETECRDGCSIVIWNKKDDRLHELSLNNIVVWSFTRKEFYKPNEPYTQNIWCPRLRLLL